MRKFGILLIAAFSSILSTAYQQPIPSSPSKNYGSALSNRQLTPPNASSMISRTNFNKIMSSSLFIPFCTIMPPEVNAFDGGVGGLGKTKPQTNVVFANPEMIEDDIITPGDYNAELIAPDGRLIFLSFYAPWPMLKSQGIESRDLAYGESSFVQVANVPKNYVPGTPLSKEFFIDSIFGSTGKYGMYGSPTDVKIRKAESEGKNELYLASFTTLTPAMRESDRKAYISTSIVGGGVFMLVSGTTTSRWKTQEPLLRKTAESFICTEAPKSSFRK